MLSKRLFTIVVFFLIFIPIAIFILSKLSNTNKKITTDALKPILRIIENPFERDLEKIVKDKLINKDEKYAVFIKDLKNGSTYSYNANDSFESASLYKLWVMAAAFQKINNGFLKEDEILTAPITRLDEILIETSSVPDVLEESIPTPSPTPSESEMITMVTKDALEKMITVSDNYAALLVASRAGSFAVTNFLKEYEFKNSSFRQPPKTIALDIGKYFEKLYKGEIVSADYSEEMIDILKKQTINDRIPKYLPANISVAHKTGELGGFKHDAGIVFTKKGDYIIVVLSKTKDPYVTAEKIANFSKQVYNYFQKT